MAHRRDEDDDDFLEEPYDSVLNDSDVGSHQSQRLLVCRNPQFVTPGPVKKQNVRPVGHSPALSMANRILQNIHQGNNYQTATPIRGPMRFMRVACPVEAIEEDEYDEEEEEEVEESTENRLPPQSTNRAKPVTKLQSADPIRSPVDALKSPISRKAVSPIPQRYATRSRERACPAPMQRKSPRASEASPVLQARVTRSTPAPASGTPRTRSKTPKGGIPTPAANLSTSFQRKSRVRKKVSEPPKAILQPSPIRSPTKPAIAPVKATTEEVLGFEEVTWPQRSPPASAASPVLQARVTTALPAATASPIRSRSPITRTETPKARVPTSAANLTTSFERRSRIRKKLSVGAVVQNKPPETINRVEEPLDLNQVDSPFFKMPLPPKAIKKPAFLLKKSLPESRLMKFSNPPPQVYSSSEDSESAAAAAPQEPFKRPAPVKKRVLTKKRPLNAQSNKVEVEPKKAKMSEKAASVEEDQNMDEFSVDNSVDKIDALYEKARYVTNWVPKMKSSKLIIEGDLLDFTAKDPNHHKERWFTSRVIERCKPNLVMTKGGPYVLEGIMNFAIAVSSSTPQFIITAFKTGVPERWDMLRAQWRQFIKQQRNLEDMSSMSTITNMSEQSGFVHAMNFSKQSTSSLPMMPMTSSLLWNPQPSTSRASHNLFNTSIGSLHSIPEEKGHPKKVPTNEAKKALPAKKAPPARKAPPAKRAPPAKKEPPAKRAPAKTKPAPVKSNTKLPLYAAFKPDLVTRSPKKTPRAKQAPAKTKPAPVKGNKKLPTKKQQQKDASLELSHSNPKPKIVDDNNARKRNHQKATAAISRYYQEEEEPPKKVPKNKAPTAKKAPLGKKAPAKEKSAPAKEEGPSKKVLNKKGPTAKKSPPVKKAPVKKAPTKEKAAQAKENPAPAKEKPVPVKGNKKLPPKKQQQKDTNLQMSNLNTKPKTVADMQNNDKILKAHNVNHEDNLFKTSTATGAVVKKSSKKAEGNERKAADILGDLFDSDSEQNISLHSARTPITAYFDRNRSKTIENEDEENQENQEEGATGDENYTTTEEEPGFQEHAFVTRKAKEAKRRHRLMKTVAPSPLFINTKEAKARKKNLEKATLAISRYSQEVNN